MITALGMASSEPFQVGKYEVIARIAQGGMAEIFLARQPGIGGFSRRVVLKCILPALAEEPRFVQMFMEEARLASQIHHPNVVQIFDVGEEDDEYFIAMEYIDGLSVGSMSTLPDGDQRKLPIPVAGEIVAQACSGLAAAHKLTSEDGKPLGLVHRDVSPQNLMVSRDGVVKLVDFGIAKAQDSSVTTRTGNIKGKYAYMSPEQVRGRPLDRRSDIFSLGTLLFELITGTRLFHRSGELAILVAIIEDPFPTAHEVDPSIPEALSDVILKSLQRDREERYSNAAEFGAAVREVMGKLGHYTSPEIVAKYLEDECADQLSAREIDGLGTPVSGKSLPAGQFPEGESERQVLPEIIDLPPPGGVRSFDRDRAMEEAKRSGNRASWLDVKDSREKKKPSPIVIVDRKAGPLPEPDFPDDDDYDDEDIGEAETAIAPIPPENLSEEPPEEPHEELTEEPPEVTEEPSEVLTEETPSKSMASAPLFVEAPSYPDLPEEDEDFDDAETVQRFIDSEESDAVTVVRPLGPSEQEPVSLETRDPKPGWVEVATDSALPDLANMEEAESEEPDRSPSLIMSPAQPPAPDEPGSVAPSVPSKAYTETKGNSKRNPPKRVAPSTPAPAMGRLLWVVLVVVVVLGVGVGLFYHFTSSGGRPSGAPLLYAHPPSYPEATIVKELRPLADYLEKRMHRPIDLVTTPDYESMQDELLEGDIQFANLPPLLFVLSRQRDPNLKVLVVHAFEDSKTDQSFIIARDDTGIRTIEQLKGRSFCHPDPRSTTGYLLPRQFLRSKGLDPSKTFSKVIYSEGHVGVLEDIVEGRCDAGAVISSAWSNASNLGVKAQRLRMVTAAGETMRDVVCASPMLPTSLTESLRRALLDFQSQRDIGRGAVSPLFVIDRFVKVRPEDFLSVEEAARSEGMLH